MKVIVFGSKYCKPCHTWKRMLKEAGIEFEYVDVEKDPQQANAFLVTSLPTTIVYNPEIGAVMAFEVGTSRKFLKWLKEALNG